MRHASKPRGNGRFRYDPLLGYGEGQHEPTQDNPQQITESVRQSFPVIKKKIMEMNLKGPLPAGEAGSAMRKP